MLFFLLTLILVELNIDVCLCHYRCIGAATAAAAVIAAPNVHLIAYSLRQQAPVYVLGRMY